MACDCAQVLGEIGNRICSQSDGSLSQTVSARFNDDPVTIHETLYGKALKGCKGEKSEEDGGTPGAPAPMRFCHWQSPEYGNKGEEWWTLLFQGAALAIAIANGLAQQEIADKQQDLADGWYQQAKYKWNRYASTYIPLELKLLNEVSTTPVPSLDCRGAETRARQAVDTAYDSIGDYLAQQAKSLRLCIDGSLLKSMGNRQNLALVDSRNYNYVDDRWFRDYKDDQRWNRRSNVLNLGRNLDSEALSYGQVANALYGQVGQQIDRAASGLVTALGYFGARNDTYYPTTYLGTGGNGAGGSIISIGTPGSVNPVGLNPTGGG